MVDFKKEKKLATLRPEAQSKTKVDAIEATVNNCIKYIFIKHFDLADKRGDITLNDSGLILFSVFRGSLIAIAKEAARRGIPNDRINEILDRVVSLLYKEQAEKPFDAFEARSLLN
jgi:hypothetical protein